MNIEAIVQQLMQERARLELAIAALRGSTGAGLSATGKKRGRLSNASKELRASSAKASRSGGITPAGRKRLSDAMKARWAKRKASKKPLYREVRGKMISLPVLWRLTPELGVFL